VREVVNKIKVVKLKRKDTFNKQRYKVFIDDNEITGVRAVSVSMSAEDIPVASVNIQFNTTDFQWVNEGESVEPLADGPTDKEVNS
jgi:hypothetical protein